MLELVGLYLHLGERFRAALAAVRLIVHQVLDATDDYRVLKFTLTDSFNEHMHEAAH